MYKIQIMSKEECTLFSTRNLEDDCIIISINDSITNTVIFENDRIKDILVLKFDDLEEDLPPFKTISKQDTTDIKLFIDKYKDSIKTIIVHCTAGISRSGAVGCCLARYLNGNDDYLLSTGRYIPNKTVYKLLSEELGLEYSDKLFKRKLKIRNTGNIENLKGYGDYGIDLSDMFCDVIISNKEKRD